MALSTPLSSNNPVGTNDLINAEITGAVEMGFSSRKTGMLSMDRQLGASGSWQLQSAVSSFVVSNTDETVGLGDAGIYSDVRLNLTSAIVARRPYATESFKFMAAHAKSRDWQAIGKKLANDYDEAVVNAIIRGGFSADGIKLTDSAANLALSNKLEKKIAEARVQLQMNDVEVEDMFLLVRPDTYNLLAESDMITSAEFSTGNGSYSSRTILKAGGMQVVMVGGSTFGKAIPAHALGTAYNVSADQAKTKAVLCSSRSVAILSDSDTPSNMEIKDDVNHNVIFEGSLMLATAPWNSSECAVIAEA